jgi:hypothetical protein
LGRDVDANLDASFRQSRGAGYFGLHESEELMHSAWSERTRGISEMNQIDGGGGNRTEAPTD